MKSVREKLVRYFEAQIHAPTFFSERTIRRIMQLGKIRKKISKSKLFFFPSLISYIYLEQAQCVLTVVALPIDYCCPKGKSISAVSAPLILRSSSLHSGY